MELKLMGLTKEFKDVTAVEDVSCRLTAGVYGLLGVNGAGKTTLMRMLCTLLKPTRGRITWNGKDILEMDRAYRKLWDIFLRISDIIRILVCTTI